MQKNARPVYEVQQFLNSVKNIIKNESNVMINNKPWNGKENKTRTYMAETGIKKADILRIVSMLEVENYCETRDDRNARFQGETVWIFGIREEIVDVEEDLYIKLKIRCLEDQLLLVMSFHPELPHSQEEKLTFPYKVYDN
ncbi:MAG: type II toxin-antitoxin system MqsR family toxin [Clostridium sp.]|nr:type II toxin-antitoxin system MqsR family toxin [Clostridium sp.]